MRWEKWPILDLLGVRGWPYRPKKETMFCEFSQCFSCFFVYFLTSQHHTTHTPYHTHFSLFPLVFSVFQHAQHRTTYTLTTTHTHTHMHTCHWPWSWEWFEYEPHAENPRKCLKKAKPGESLARARADTDGQIVRLRQSGERRIEPSGSWFPQKFPSFSRKKRMIRGIGNVLLSTYSQTSNGQKSDGYSRWTPRASDNSTWTIYGKPKFGDEGRTWNCNKVLLHMSKNHYFLDKKCEVLSRETLFHWIGPLMNVRSYSVKQCFSG